MSPRCCPQATITCGRGSGPDRRRNCLCKKVIRWRRRERETVHRSGRARRGRLHAGHQPRRRSGCGVGHGLCRVLRRGSSDHDTESGRELGRLGREQLRVRVFDVHPLFARAHSFVRTDDFYGLLQIPSSGSSAKTSMPSPSMSVTLSSSYPVSRGHVYLKPARRTDRHRLLPLVHRAVRGIGWPRRSTGRFTLRRQRTRCACRSGQAPAEKSATPVYLAEAAEHGGKPLLVFRTVAGRPGRPHTRL